MSNWLAGQETKMSFMATKTTTLVGSSTKSPNAVHENDADEEPTCAKNMSGDHDVAMECSLCTRYYCGLFINMDDDESWDDVVWLYSGCHEKTMNNQSVIQNVKQKFDIHANKNSTLS